MDSNTVLGKIVALLSVKADKEVKFAFAKLSDGTILESPTFDVGEMVEVVSEDGTKTPAPDGEHELELTGAEGETVRFKIITEGGVITERENVELEDTEEKEEEMSSETEEVEDIPQALEEEVTEEEEKEVTINLEEVAEKVEKMAYRIDELEKKLKMQEEEIKEEEEMEEEEDDKEMEAKKLDGAPVEASKFSKVQKQAFKTSYHSSVLSRMYNK